MIDINQFIKDFTEQLIDNDLEITSEVKFRELSSWDSLTAMAVIVMIEDDYKVKINEEEFKKLETIGDIIEYINEKS